jgi:hypothetical protein
MLDVFGLGVDASGPVGEPAPEIGQRQPSGRTSEQTAAQPVLEARYRPRYCGDGNVQLRAAPALDRSSATLTNIANPSKSGSLDMLNPATMVFRIFYFGMIWPTTSLSHPSGETS